jgi:hypothetical protein
MPERQACAASVRNTRPVARRRNDSGVERRLIARTGTSTAASLLRTPPAILAVSFRDIKRRNSRRGR